MYLFRKAAICMLRGRDRALYAIPFFTRPISGPVTPSKMNKVTMIPRQDYLYVYIQGETDSYQIARGNWTRISSEITECRLRRVLIVEDIAAELSDSDAFRVASELSALGFAGVRIAIVDIDSKHRISTDFAVLVGSNRGINVRAFEDVEAAEQWLVADAI